MQKRIGQMKGSPTADGPKDQRSAKLMPVLVEAKMPADAKSEVAYLVKDVCKALAGTLELGAYGLIGAHAASIEKGTLNEVLVFKGYAGRSHEALADLLTVVSGHEDAEIRRYAYIGLSNLDCMDLSFFLERTKNEMDGGPLYALGDCILRAVEKQPDRSEVVMEQLGALLGSSNRDVRSAIIDLFMGLKSENSVRMALGALATERDPYVFGLLRGIAQNDMAFGILTSDMQLLKKVACSQLERGIGNVETFFREFIPGVEDIRNFAASLNERQTRALLKIGRNELRAQSSWQYRIGYEYFRAAVNGALIETEVLGERFSYFLMPEKKLSNSQGRVILHAHAVSKSVPENLRKVVAYHEYVEGGSDANEHGTNSQKRSPHEIAVEQELLAAKALGVEKELLDWLKSIGEDKRF